jgi:ribosomal protein S25
MTKDRKVSKRLVTTEDLLFAEVLKVIGEVAEVSASLLQRRLKISYFAAEKLINRLQEEGRIAAFDGSHVRQVLARGKRRKEVTTLPAGDQRHRSYKVQQELWKSHAASAEISQIAEIVESGVFRVLCAYLSEDRYETFRRIDDSPEALVREISSNVAKQVAGIVATEPGWPNDGAQISARHDELVLTAKEMQSLLSCRHVYRPTLAQSQHHSRAVQHELAEHPGWPHGWLASRLRDEGCFVGRTIWPTQTVDRSISYVLIRRDGSGYKVGVDGSISEFAPGPSRGVLKPIAERFERWLQKTKLSTWPE